MEANETLNHLVREGVVYLLVYVPRPFLYAFIPTAVPIGM